MINLFDIENEKVVISPNVLLIPEFKTIVDKYEDYIPALSYIYFMSSPHSPYSDVPERDKQQIVSEDVGGDFGLEDDEIEEAIKKAEFLYTTPTRRFFINAKKGLETLGDYLGSTQISEGKDGNFSAFGMAYTRIGKTIQEFKILEKEYTEEITSNIRGGHDIGYDER